MHTKEQGSRASCLARRDFAAFGKGVQLINGSSSDEAKQVSWLIRQMVYLMISNQILTYAADEMALIVPNPSLNAFL